MNGILFLNKEDFTIKKAEKGDLLAFRFDARGLTLVLFYSVECKYCDVYLKSFKQMPLTINGCRFAMINISKNMEVVRMSRNTVAPITYVPDVILYVDGLPFMRYDGAPNIQKIRSFIMDIYQKLQQKNQFVPPRPAATASQPLPVQQSAASPMLPGSHGPPPYHTRPTEIKEEKKPAIPAYSLGLPVSGSGDRDSNRCYLNYDDAYVAASSPPFSSPS
jgi:hypothetical protein